MSYTFIKILLLDLCHALVLKTVWKILSIDMDIELLDIYTASRTIKWCIQFGNHMAVCVYVYVSVCPMI